ncbi:MAG: adenylate/guanylate cyclase domain-containing protein [Isosphaeraceae bacterium]|nr:adenylate/guanylate cyclase domain-containing protein [Isosphaeraceae bacterium]
MLLAYVSHKNHTEKVVIERGSLVIGRNPQGPTPRKVLPDPFVSGDHLRIEELPGGRIRLENLSRKVTVNLASGEVLLPGDLREVMPPVRMTLGETVLQLEGADDEPEEQSLQTIARPLGPRPNQTLSRLPLDNEQISAEVLARWFEGLVSVQRASASTGEFFRQTARAVVELIGLDCGLVLQHRADGWNVLARHDANAQNDAGYSRTVLDRVYRERQTYFQDPSPGSATRSLVDVGAVVAAPVLDEQGQVAGAVYGARFRRSGGFGVAIRPLEAQLMQVLAASVSAGLARVQSEADTARRRVQFEQFFSPELARELDRDPNLLDGREREVTILFSDLRGFSRHSERLDPRDVCLLAQDVMDRLTERVREFGGTVVSYSGDGMMALWNAPADQHDHAVLACRAALAMQAEMPVVEAAWKDRLAFPLRLGVGLNTGRALVGNTGSRSKFMYGPQGHAVNLASRVEGATKQLGSPILITESTNAQLGGQFATRRLCRARVVGIDGCVDLYELYATVADDAWRAERDTYESGLTLYEAGRWWEACRTLYALLAGHETNYDLPTLTLVGRCIECLKGPQTSFDPVFVLGQK